MYENIIKLQGCKKDIPITLSTPARASSSRGTGLTNEKILPLAEDAPYPQFSNACERIVVPVCDVYYQWCMVPTRALAVLMMMMFITIFARD